MIERAEQKLAGNNEVINFQCKWNNIYEIRREI